MLKEIAKQHKHWIDIVRYYGEHQYDEDIVQEMYLRVNKYADESKVLTNGEVNGGYIRFVLMTITYDYHKSKQKIDKFSIGEGFDIEDESNEDEIGYGRFLQRLDQEMNSWEEFDRKVFKVYVGTYGSQNVETYGQGITLRAFAAESNISINTIFKTLKNCKERIRENVGEHWIDFINKDFELI